jgi:large subunit ribosomal protein L10
MTLRLEDKQQIVTEVNAVAAQALSAVVVDYQGVSVANMTKLRAKARATGVHLRVVRNTLARRAVEGTDFACLKDALVGPLILAFSQEEPGAAARLIRDFAKEMSELKVKALAIGGQLLAANQLEAVSKLPTKQEALATLCGTMLAPITKFVRTLAEPHSQVVRVMGQIRDQKQAA